MTKMHSLENQFLIAMPTMVDPYFERALLYVIEHNDDGAMGLILNQPVGLSLDQLLIKMKLQQQDFVLPAHYNSEVVVGGPVVPERGFVLHSPCRGFQSSQSLNDALMVTTSKDVLNTFGTSKAPAQNLVALGYSGWDKGQLEQEILDNAWLTAPASLDLIFEVPIAERWGEATRRLGFDPAQLSTQVGHA